MSLDEPEREVLAGVGLDRPLPPPPPGQPAAPQAAPGPLPSGEPPPSGNGALPGPPAVPAAALKLVKKAQKKAAKEARKVRCALLLWPMRAALGNAWLELAGAQSARLGTRKHIGLRECEASFAGSPAHPNERAQAE